MLSITITEEIQRACLKGFVALIYVVILRTSHYGLGRLRLAITGRRARLLHDTLSGGHVS